MAGIAGWIGDASPTRMAQSAALLAKFDGAGTDIGSAPGRGVIVADRLGDRSVCRDGDWLAAIWGAIRFADDRLAARARETSAASALLAGYLEHGPRVVERMRGHFAVAIMHASRSEAFAAIDRAGVRPLVYRTTPAGFGFASSADLLRFGTDWHATPDPQAIYDYVHFHVIPGPQTIYRGVQRLMPGEYVLYRDGSLQTGRYWQMRFNEDDRRDFGVLRQEFHEVLGRSVGRALSHSPAGCFLSGGTDSSTVSGMAGKVAGSPAETFSIGFDEPDYDELGYARIAARHFKTKHHEYNVTPQDIVDAIPLIAEIHDQPFGNSSAVPTYFCARMGREHGVRVLLAGDGGDELFGGNERYATQYLFSLYGQLPAPLRKGILDPLAALAPTAIAPARWFKRYVEISSIPMPDRLDTYNLLERLGPASVFTSDFLGAVATDHPLLVMRAAYENAQAGSLINRMLGLDLQITLADNDLPKVMRSCELAGMEVAFPILDDDVMDFSARLAPNMKLRGRRLRYFFKEALTGFLPDEILRKKKHGFGLPFGPWLPRHPPLFELVGDSLSTLRRRGIVRGEFLDSLLSNRLQEHASYFGTMAWVLTMLEQWYARHAEAGTRQPATDIGVSEHKRVAS